MATMTFSAPAALPPGRYGAVLGNVVSGEGKFGPFLDWQFDVVDADGNQKQVSRRTSTKTGTGAIARVIVEALLGRSVRLDEEVDLDGLIGRELLLEIETNQNGYDSVANAFPAKGAADVDDLPF